MSGQSLQLWLKKAPRPIKVRVRKDDGDPEVIDPKGFGSGKRVQWAKLEETILSIEGGVSVDCLTVDGTILRSLPLSEGEDDEDREAEREDRTGRALSKDRRELAAILDSQGRAIERAYAAGAEASAASLQSLIDTVRTVTDHYTATITSLHNLSVNYANALQSIGKSGDEGDEAGQGLKALAGMLMPMLMPHLAQSPEAPPKSNGAHPKK